MFSSGWRPISGSVARSTPRGHVAQVLPGEAAIARTEQVLAAGVDRGRCRAARSPSARPSWPDAWRCPAPAPARSCPTCSSCGDRRWRRWDHRGGCPAPATCACRCAAARGTATTSRRCAWSLGVGDGEEPVAAAQTRPVFVQHAARGPAGARPHPAAVVLQAAVDVVGERRCRRRRGSTATAAATTRRGTCCRDRTRCRCRRRPA